MIISQVKKRYIVLKSKLRVFISNILNFIFNIDFYFEIGIKNLVLYLKKQKNNIFIVFKRGNTIFHQYLTIYITFFILLKIYI